MLGRNREQIRSGLPVELQRWLKFAFLCVLMVFAFTRVTHASPAALSYQGRIIKDDGTPLKYSSVSFIFKITDPSGTCIVYKEQKNGYDMSQSNGLFDVAIGSGTVVHPNTGSFTIINAFNNTAGPLACEGGGFYSPSSGDNRRLRVQFWDGIGWSALQSDLIVRSVPYASYASAAERLGSYLPTDFVLKSSVPTCVVGEYLTFIAGAWTCQSLSSAGLGTVTSITAGAGLTGGTITSSGTIGLGTELAGVNALATTGFVKRTGVGAYTTSSVIDLATDITGTLPLANGGTGATSATGALTNLLPSQSGQSGKVLQTDGTNVSWISLSAGTIQALTGDVVASGSGTVTATISNDAVTSAKILDGTIATADIGNAQVTDAKIVGVAVDKITSGAGKYFTYLPNNAACTNGGVLKWSTANSRWECGTDDAGPGGTVTGLSGDVSTTGSGALTVSVDSIKNIPLTYTAIASGQYLKYNGTAWVNSNIAIADVTNLSTQLAGKIEASQMPASCSANQTLTFTSPTGTWTCSTISVSGSNFASATANTVFAAPNGSAGAPSFRSLAAADLPTSGVTAGTYKSVTVDIYGRVTTGTNPLVNLATDVSGTLPIANGGTGATTASAAINNLLPAQTGNSGKILQTDGTNITWVDTPATGITALTGEVTATGSGSVAATIANNAVTSAKILDGTIATADIGNAQVTDAKIAGVAVDKITSGAGKYFTYLPNNAACVDGGVLKWSNANSRWECGTDDSGAGGTVSSLSGDVSTTGSGALTVTVDRIKNIPLTFTSIASGQYLKYNGSAWVNSNIAISDVTNLSTQLAAKIDASQMPANCSAGETLTFSSPTGTWTCTPISVSGSNFASTAANRIFASPNGSAGTPSFRSLAAADLPTSGATAGTYKSVTVDIYGRVTAGTNPLVSLTADVSGTLPIANGGTGATTATAALNNLLPTQTGNSGKILQTDGTNATWVATPVTGITALTGEVTASGTGSVVATIANDAVTSAKILDGTIATADIGNAQVTDGKIVGVSVDKITSGAGKYFTYLPNNAACTNGGVLKWSTANSRWECGTDDAGPGGTVTGLAGDVSTTGSGTLTVSVDKIKNIPLTFTSLTSGQSLKYNGTAWVNTNITASDLPTSGATAGTYKSVTVDIYGRVTAGTNPTTVAGYGITDAVINGGQSGAVVLGPSTANSLTLNTNGAAALTILSGGNVGIGLTNPSEKLEVNGNIKGTQLCIGTDCRSSWPVSSSGGTVTSVTAGTGLTGGTITGTGTIGLGTELAGLNAVNTTGFMKRTAAGTYSTSAAISLTTDITGTLPIANGGTGATTATAALNNLLPTQTGNSGKILQTDGANATWVNTPVTGITALTGEVTASGTGSVAATIANDAVTSAKILDGTIATADIGNAQVTDAKIVGVAVDKITSGAGKYFTYLPNNAACTNGGVLKWSTADSRWECGTDDAGPGGTVTGLSGDVSTTGTGALTVTVDRVKNIPLTFTSIASGQYLKYNGSAWVNSNIAISDVTNLSTQLSAKIDASQMPANCSAGQTLTFSSPTGTWSCTAISVSGSNFASATANTVFAAPNGSAGTPSFRSLVAADLPTSGATAGTYRSVTVDTYGRVTAGTNPTTVSGYGITDAVINGGQAGAVTLGPSSANDLTFNTNGTAKMTILSGGNVGIGNAAPAYNLDVTGTVRATSFISTSDRRLKKEIETVSGLETVLKLRGVRFKWKSDDRPEYGTIAQEVEAVLPDLVATDPKSGFKAVRYLGLIAPLIEATKDLNEKCEMSAHQYNSLAEKVAKVENDVVTLKRRLASVESENQEMKEMLKELAKRVKEIESKDK